MYILYIHIVDLRLAACSHLQDIRSLHDFGAWASECCPWVKVTMCFLFGTLYYGDHVEKCNLGQTTEKESQPLRAPDFAPNQPQQQSQRAQESGLRLWHRSAAARPRGAARAPGPAYSFLVVSITIFWSPTSTANKKNGEKDAKILGKLFSSQARLAGAGSCR